MRARGPVVPGVAALCLRELPILHLVVPAASVGALGVATATLALEGAPGAAICAAVPLVGALAFSGLAVFRAARVAARVRRLLVRDDAGRVYATVHRIPLGETKRFLPKYRFEVRLRPHRSGREGGEARIQPTREPPPVWLQSLPLRAPLRLHGELSTGAIVVLEGPRGELVPARVVDRGTGEPPARWSR